MPSPQQYLVIGWYEEEEQTTCDVIEATTVASALLKACVIRSEERLIAVVDATTEDVAPSNRCLMGAEEIRGCLGTLEDQLCRQGARSGLYRCANCAHIYDHHEEFTPLHECEHLHERLMPGGEVPFGECVQPDCGALVFRVDLDEIKARVGAHT